jgi:UDP-2,3-diacylglucosamine pyrophosphatase LpxH
MLFPSLLARGLSRVLKAARESGPIPLADQHRYVIFSDHHKGAGTDADDFKLCKETYLAALDHYFDRGYHLIILGDAEELWEESIEQVQATYGQVFESERRFHQQDRFLKIFGNHDNNWASKGQIAKHLHPIFPDLEVSEGLVFTYAGPTPESSGEVFLAHGHQGTLDSEVFPTISRFFVRTVWRTVQIVTRYSGTQPSKDDKLRGEHDTLMYEWATKQGKMLLIAGHTHREIWSSRTQLERKLIEIQALEEASQHATIPDLDAQLTRLRAEYETLRANEKFKYDTIKTRGCYFNDGCCSFSDGSVTAYELEDGQLRLVRWERDSQAPSLVDEGQLADIFYEL